MNAPYDGDRGQGAGGAGPSGGSPTPPDPGQVDPAPDPYLQDAYNHDPYRAQDLSAQDPVAEVLYDRAAHPPPPPGTYQSPQPLYQQPPAAQYAPIRASGHRRRRPSPPGRPGICRTAKTPQPPSSSASTTSSPRHPEATRNRMRSRTCSGTRRGRPGPPFRPSPNRLRHPPRRSPAAGPPAC